MTPYADVDIAIIGGGIVGLACAYQLQKRGLKIAVVDKGNFSSEQSRRNSGFIRQQGRDIRELELARRSLELWEEFAGEAGEDIGFRRRGNLAVTSNPNKFVAMQDWVKVAKEFGIRSQILDGPGLAQIMPRLRTGFLGGLYTSNDAQAEPFLAGPALAAYLKRQGVLLLDNTLVTGLARIGGQVSGVQTEAGEVRASQVILAGGLWSRMFLARYGVSLPLSDLRITVGRTAPFDHGLSIPTWTPGVLVRPRLDGGLTIALGQDGPCDYDMTIDSVRVGFRYLPSYLANRSGVTVRPLGRHGEYSRWRRAYAGGEQANDRAEIANYPVAPNSRLLAKCVSVAALDFSFDRPLSLVENWACRADVTPDGIPVIDDLEALPGLMVVAGMSGHGFGLSMGVGEAVADRLTTGKRSEVLKPFAMSRFQEKFFLKPMNVL